MKNLKKFISWVGTKKEFKGLNEGQIIEALNEMSSSKDGKNEVAKLMAEFKQDQKIENASEVLKAQNGMAVRRAQRQAYRDAMSNAREAARAAANAVVLPEEETSNAPVFDRNKARQIMVDNGILNRQTRTNWDGETLERYRKGDNWSRLNARKARAAATEGFDESMYNFSPDAEFDRARYRDRMRTARLTPGLDTRRERVAFALQDPYAKVDIPVTSMFTPQAASFEPMNTNISFADDIAATEAELAKIKPASMPVARTASGASNNTTNWDYWLREAKKYGFNTIDEVKAWQRKNGLAVDGKFGNNSAAKWRSLQTNTSTNGQAPLTDAEKAAVEEHILRERFNPWKNIPGFGALPELSPAQQAYRDERLDAYGAEAEKAYQAKVAAEAAAKEARIKQLEEERRQRVMNSSGGARGLHRTVAGSAWK